MKPEKAYTFQGYLYVLAALSAIVSFSSKGVLTGNKKYERSMDFQYFVENFREGGVWVYVHWFSSAVFIASLIAVIFLERSKKSG